MSQLMNEALTEVELSKISQYPRFTLNPPLYQQVAARLFGTLKVGVDSDSAHFVKPTPIYAWRCRKGVWIQDYRHGFDRHFNCPFVYDLKVTCESCLDRARNLKA
jgi:hypothetical protein